MAILKMLLWVWFVLIIISGIFFFVGVIIEKNFDESHPIKKWWRRHFVAPDPDDNNWKNFNG